jgi:hypothetical protein
MDEKSISLTAKSIRKFNEYVSKDNSIGKMILPVFDGLMFIWHASSNRIEK